MKVRYTKSFEKAVDKLSGKQLKSVLDVIKEVKEAQRIEDITLNLLMMWSYSSSLFQEARHTRRKSRRN